jgi:hypothetical protein
MTIEIGEVVVDENGDATGSGLSFKIFEEIMGPVGTEASRAVATSVGPFCVGLATALIEYWQEEGDEKLNLDGSNSPMKGNLDLGGFVLTNFHNGRSSGKVSLTGGGDLTTILTYATGLAQHEIMRVGVEVLVWEAGDRSVCGHVVTEVSIYGTASGLSLSRTDFADTNALPSGADVALTSSGTSLVVQAQATANNCYAVAKLWHQPKYALTT